MCSNKAQPAKRAFRETVFKDDSWLGDTHRAELGTFGIFEFFQKQKMIFCIFFKLIWLGVGFLKRTGA